MSVHGYMVQQATPSYVLRVVISYTSPILFFFIVMSWQPYDNTGAVYNVTRILNDDGNFNLEHYKAYSPLFLSYVSISSTCISA